MSQQRLTIDEARLPAGATFLNLWGSTLQRIGFSPRLLDAKSLLQEAKVKTGLSERGEAKRFDAGLEHLLESAQTETRLTPFGRAFLRQDCVSVLSSQLLVEELFRGHPEARELPVRRPLFLVGFFRSGTTMLQRILGENHHTRSLRFWESLRPVSGEPSSTPGKDSRIEAAEKDIRTFSKFLMPKVHQFEAGAPEEDLFLLRHMFSSLIQWSLFAGDRFLHRLLHQEMRPAYEYLRSLLQALHWQEPGGPWVLKTGQHLLDLDVIAEVFPDACFVWTQRDPNELVPSFLSTAACIRSGTHPQPLDLSRLAENCLEMVDVAHDRAMKSEIVRQGDRILHVAYEDLVRDPVAVATEICGRFELPLDGGVEQRMSGWVAANRQHRLGRHTYSLEPFGVDAEHIRARYAEYTERYIDARDDQKADGTG